MRGPPGALGQGPGGMVRAPHTPVARTGPGIGPGTAGVGNPGVPHGSPMGVGVGIPGAGSAAAYSSMMQARANSNSDRAAAPNSTGPVVVNGGPPQSMGHGIMHQSQQQSQQQQQQQQQPQPTHPSLHHRPNAMMWPRGPGAPAPYTPMMMTPKGSAMAAAAAAAASVARPRIPISRNGSGILGTNGNPTV